MLGFNLLRLDAKALLGCHDFRVSPCQALDLPAHVLIDLLKRNHLLLLETRLLRWSRYPILEAVLSELVLASKHR